MLDKKRGVTHVEMIISFTMFLFGMILLIGLLGSRLSHDIYLSTALLEKNITASTLIEITEIPLFVSGTGCKSIEVSTTTNLTLLNSDKTKKLDYAFSDSTVSFVVPSCSTENEKCPVYFLYSPDEDLTETLFIDSFQCSQCEDCVWGASMERKVFSYKRFEEINQSYWQESGYEALAKQIGSNYAILVYKENELIFEMQKKIPKGVPVYATELYGVMFNQSLFPVKIVLKVW